jgi:hypothetical protein
MDALAAAAASTLSSGGDAPSSGAAADALFGDYTGAGSAMEAFLRSLEPAQLAALLVHLGAKTREESEELLRGAGGRTGSLVAAVRAALAVVAAAGRAPQGRAVDAGDCGGLRLAGAAAVSAPPRPLPPPPPPRDSTDARVSAAARAVVRAQEEARALVPVAVGHVRAFADAKDAGAEALHALNLELGAVLRCSQLAHSCLLK